MYYRKLELLGVGVRYKAFGPIKAKVYAVGYYVSNKLAVLKSLKQSFNNAKDFISSNSFSSILNAQGSNDQAFVLKMARSVGADTMVNALAESVEPRMNGSDSDSLLSLRNLLLDGLKNGGAKTNMELRYNFAHTVCID